MLDWVKGFEFPDFERDYEFVALRHPHEYPFNEGQIVSSLGLDIPASEYERHFVEEHVRHSNALQGAKRAPVEGDPGAVKSYLVGPLARYSLNFDRLTPAAQQAARDAGLGPVCRNPFHSILVRSVETLWAVRGGAAHRRRLRAAGRARGPGRAARRHGRGRDRGPARAAVPPLPHRGGRQHRRREDHPADLAEPEVHRGGPLAVHRAPARPGRRDAHLAVRAGGAQLRPLHLVRDPLPEAAPGGRLDGRTAADRHRPRGPVRRRRGRARRAAGAGVAVAAGPRARVRRGRDRAARGLAGRARGRGGGRHVLGRARRDGAAAGRLAGAAARPSCSAAPRTAWAWPRRSSWPARWAGCRPRS